MTNKKSRIIIKDSSLDECERLQAICDSWQEKKMTEGEAFESNYVFKCLTQGDLPPIPNASKSNYRFRSIYVKSDQTLIGFFDLYFGYPRKDVVWIGMFMIDPKHRRKKYGQEALDLIRDDIKNEGYMKIGLGVHLKNWQALRFWTSLGFSHIMGIFGDNIYGEDNFAVMGLEKDLTFI